MKGTHGLFIFTLALSAGFFARLQEIKLYEAKLASASSMICDVIQVRAQGGSTRDVHDQIFSFLRRRSPDPLSNVVVSNGSHEVGSQLSGEGNNLTNINCAIENSPDYKIKMSFHKLNLLNLDLVEWVSGFFVALMLLFLGIRSTLKFVAGLWSREVISTLRTDLGLSSPKIEFESSLVGHFTRRLSHWMSGHLDSIKVEIHQLKNEIETKNKSLQLSEDVLASQSQILKKAKLFEEKVQMVKHDLKSPLSSMKFAIFNQAKESEVLPEIISTIEKIVKDLEVGNTNATIEANKNINTAVLEVIAKEATEQKRNELGKNAKIEISFTYDENALSPVMVNPDYLGRVITNLIQNAIEAIGSREGKVSLKIFQNNDVAQIEITDNGRGIPAEIKDALFNKGTTFGKTSGDGLGLHFVKSCLNSWGGDIFIQSTNDSGTTFLLSLPLVKRLNGLFAGPSSIEPNAEIIIVDDDAEVLKLMWARQKIVCHTTPQQFIEWWESDGHESTSTIVMDMHLSKHINGLDLLREIGSRDQTFISTHDFLNEDVIETVAEFGIKIIPKPLIWESPIT